MVDGVPQIDAGTATDIRLTVHAIDPTAPVAGVEARIDLDPTHRVNDAGLEPTEILDPAEGAFGDLWPLSWSATAEEQGAEDRYFMSVFSVAQTVTGGEDGVFDFAVVSVTGLAPGEVVLKPGSAIGILVGETPTNVDIGGRVIAMVWGSVPSASGSEPPSALNPEPEVPYLEPPEAADEDAGNPPDADSTADRSSKAVQGGVNNNQGEIVQNNVDDFVTSIILGSLPRSEGIEGSTYNLAAAERYTTPEPGPFALVAMAVGVLFLGRRIRKRRVSIH
jgi:hypothetical protein